MGLFDFLWASKKESVKPIINSIGKFSFIEFDGTKNFTGNVNSIIGQNIEILFPVNGTQISSYQIEYFKKIENSWTSIKQQLKNLNPKIDFENYKVIDIMIPDQGNEFYDVDAEIVFQKKSFIVSAILIDVSVDQLIEN